MVEGAKPPHRQNTKPPPPPSSEGAKALSPLSSFQASNLPVLFVSIFVSLSIPLHPPFIPLHPPIVPPGPVSSLCVPRSPHCVPDRSSPVPSQPTCRSRRSGMVIRRAYAGSPYGPADIPRRVSEPRLGRRRRLGRYSAFDSRSRLAAGNGVGSGSWRAVVGATDPLPLRRHPTLPTSLTSPLAPAAPLPLLLPCCCGQVLEWSLATDKLARPDQNAWTGAECSRSEAAGRRGGRPTLPLLSPHRPDDDTVIRELSPRRSLSYHRQM